MAVVEDASQPWMMRQRDSRRGVLLYYCYLPLGAGQAQAELAQWYRDTCEALELHGRIRVAEDGVNVTVGGDWERLQQHIEAIQAHPLLHGCDIDFKLAESSGNATDVVTHETGFNSLSIRICKELVTLGPRAQGRADATHNAGQHLTPHQFHQMLLQASAAAAATQPAAPPVAAEVVGALGSPAAALGNSGSGSARAGSGEVPKETVLLDARNVYETSVGHMDVDGVPLLDPHTRCFSDLPAWLDRMEPQLRGRRILMYCTGGVRCERASAYLKEKGPGFEEVYQLQGGIQRYLEAFSVDGGFFKGKNFVYDDRICVGPASSHSEQGLAAGRSAQCQGSWEGASGAAGASSSPANNDVAVHRAQVASTPAAAASAEFSGSHKEATVTFAPTTQPHLSHCQGSVGLGHDVSGTPIREAGSDNGRFVQAALWGDVNGHADGSIVVGRCVVCSGPWDDYSPRARCTACRMLVLLCDTCQQFKGSGQQHGNNQHVEQCHTWGAAKDQERREGHSKHEQSQPQPLLCVLCAGRAHQGRSRSRKGHKRAAAARAAGVVATNDMAGQSSASQASGALQEDGSGPGCGASSRRLGNLRLPGGGCAALAGSPATGDELAEGLAAPGQRRLRILCLHGFRQSGYKMLGRTCGVRKHLDDLAEFYFPDAPHVLPHFVKLPPGPVSNFSASRDPTFEIVAAPPAEGQTDTAFTATEDRSCKQGNSSVLGTSLLCRSQAQQQQQQHRQQHVMAPAAHKRAWLVSPELETIETADLSQAPGVEVAWQLAPDFVDEDQYLHQVAGWQESCQSLQAFIAKHGPFDGLLGFSQGAAIAAVLCALQQQQSLQQQQQQQQRQEQTSSGACGSASQVLEPPGIRFAILASGYCSRCPEHEQLLSAVGPLQIPSLHVFGGSSSKVNAGSGRAANPGCQQRADSGPAGVETDGPAPEGEDRQVSMAESEQLAALFAADAGRRLVRHGQGHVLPCKKQVVHELRTFLLDQLQ